VAKRPIRFASVTLEKRLLRTLDALWSRRFTGRPAVAFILGPLLRPLRARLWKRQLRGTD
jgi:hypothetical protein